MEAVCLDTCRCHWFSAVRFISTDILSINLLTSSRVSSDVVPMFRAALSTWRVTSSYWWRRFWSSLSSNLTCRVKSANWSTVLDESWGWPRMLSPLFDPNDTWKEHKLQAKTLRIIYFTIQATCKEKANEELKTTLHINFSEQSAHHLLWFFKVY